MNARKTSTPHPPLQEEALSHWMLDAPRAVGWLHATAPTSAYAVRLMRVREIFEGEASDYRRSLANVYAALDAELEASLIYVIEGAPEGVRLYFGVIAPVSSSENLREARKQLISAIEGQLPGVVLEDVADEAAHRLLDDACAAPQRGLMVGVPSFDQSEGGDAHDFQGFERLARALLVGPDGRSGERWRMVIVAQSLPREEVVRLLDEALALATEVAAKARAQLQYQLSSNEQRGVSRNESVSDAQTEGYAHQKGSNESTSEADQRGKSETGSETHQTSSGSSSSSSGKSNTKGVTTQESHTTTKTTGTQTSETRNTGTTHTVSIGESASLSRSHSSNVGMSAEVVNKKIDLLREHVEEWLTPRLKQGYARGLKSVRVLLSANTPSAYRRLVNTVLATFQGDEAALSPLTVLPVPPEARLSRLLDDVVMEIPAWQALVHSRLADGQAATLLTPEELALLAGLPQRELPGIARRPAADFALDLPTVADDEAVRLGRLIDRGRLLPEQLFTLCRQDFNKHVFVTGVTGAGKTTTCLKLLLASRLPFMVVEPAKTEYRALWRHRQDVSYFRPLADEHHALRINPLALAHRGQRLGSHIEFLNAALTAVFPMEASMPYLVKQAIVRAYEQRGWSVAENEWLGEGDPFDPAAQAWPTLAEMIAALDDVIREQKMGREFEEKYRGSLVSRLNDLTRGPLAAVLNARQAPDWLALLDARVVIELEEVKSGEGKALLMALILGAYAEAVKARHAQDASFQHLLLVEEAHRLLAQPEPGADDSRRLAVESFANLLAEVRKYGAGLIIVDQIPAKLIPDVLKNTHTKIAHRLFAADDRRALGDAMLMNEEQRDYLPKLETGQALIYCGGWHKPAHVRIESLPETGASLSEEKLAGNALQLFWRLRGRYFPTLCRVGWLTAEGDDPARLAAFVRDGQRALNALIAQNGAGEASRRSADALRRAAKSLAHLSERWQPSEAERLSYETRRAQAGARRPEELLAAAWLALACDLVALPRVEVERPAPLGLALDSPAWGALFDDLVRHLPQLTRGGDILDTALWARLRGDHVETLGNLEAYERF